jgi:phage-related protein
MSSTVGTLAVKLTAETAAFKRGISQSKGELQSLANTAKSISIAAAGAFAAMAGGLAVVTKAADVQIRSQLQLQNAFKAAGKAANIDALRAQASALQQVTLFGDEATLAMQGLLARFGQSQQAVMQLTPLIQDMAAATGTDLKPVVFALGRALTGSAGALSRYGVALTDAQKKIIQTGTQSQRLALITEALETRFAGAAQVMARTAVGAFTQLRNATGDVLEELGKIVDQPIGDFFRAMTAEVSRFANILSRLKPQTKAVMATIALGATVAAGALAAITAAALVITSSVFPALLGAAKFAFGGILAVIGLAASALVAFATAIAIVGAPIAALGLVFFGVFKGIMAGVGAIRKAWNDNLFGIQSTVVDVAGNIAEIFDTVLNALKRAFSAVFAGIGRIVIGVISRIRGETAEETRAAIAEVTERARGVAGRGAEQAEAGLGQIRTKITELARGAEKVYNDANQAITESVGEVESAFTLVQEKSAGLGDALDRSMKDIDKLGKSAGDAADQLTPLSKRLKRLDADLAEPSAQAKKMAKALEALGGRLEKTTGELAPPALPQAPGVTLEPERQREIDAIRKTGTDIGAALKSAGNTIVGAMGEAGGIIQAGVSGFEEGGIIGAIIAVVAKLLTMMETFSTQMEEINGAIRGVVGVLNNLFRAFEPLNKAVNDLLAPAFALIGGIFDAVGKLIGSLLGPVVETMKGFRQLTLVLQEFDPTLRILNTVFAIIGGVMSTLTKSISFLINFIIDAIGEFVAVFDVGFSIQLRKMRLALGDAEGEFAGVWEGVGKDIENTWLGAMDDLRFPLRDVDGELGNLGSTLRDVSGELLNAPTGFKIALARFNAALGEDRGIGVGGAGMQVAGAAGAAAGGLNVGSMTVNVTANDPEELTAQIEQEAQFQRFVATGTQQATTGRFAIRKAGQ